MSRVDIEIDIGDLWVQYSTVDGEPDSIVIEQEGEDYSIFSSILLKGDQLEKFYEVFKSFMESNNNGK